MGFTLQYRLVRRRNNFTVASPKALDSLLPWAPTVLAVPGYYRADEVEGQYIGDFEVFWEDAPDEEDRAARWSAESTRHYLSSTAAVGTVDQALLGVLKVKWAHLRSASLARSLLVVDEVHASDSYMTRLLHTLLRGHLDLGGHALLMSATLGGNCPYNIYWIFSARSTCPQ